MSYELCYYLTGFDFKICLWDRRVTGPFEKRALGVTGELWARDHRHWIKHYVVTDDDSWEGWFGTFKRKIKRGGKVNLINSLVNYNSVKLQEEKVEINNHTEIHALMILHTDGNERWKIDVFNQNFLTYCNFISG